MLYQINSYFPPQYSNLFFSRIFKGDLRINIKQTDREEEKTEYLDGGSKRLIVDRGCHDRKRKIKTTKKIVKDGEVSQDVVFIFQS